MVLLLNALVLFSLWMLAIYCAVVLYWMTAWLIKEMKKDGK